MTKKFKTKLTLATNTLMLEHNFVTIFFEVHSLIRQEITAKGKLLNVKMEN